MTVNNLPIKLQSIDKIIHISDIHVRLYKRHAEYLDVFNNLYDSIRNKKLENTIIVITGDVAHAKTDMSPEMVKMISDLLKTLADIHPTLVITGNHDLNLANPNRLDALTPVISNLNHPNLFYLRDSGIYTITPSSGPPVDFTVYSIIGSPEDWPSVQSSASKKIALYHGPINKASTDVGYSINSKITIDQFIGHDMVLLGDIHKTQFLQEFGGPGTPEIFYVGSLIQQNHGESRSGHGYAIWDVASNKVEEFVEVENPYGYVTIVLEDKKMPAITNLPKNVRLRIMVGDVDSSIVKKLQAMIRKKATIIECTINKLVSRTNSIGGSAHHVDDVNDINNQVTLIKQYINDTFPTLDEAVIDKIIEINKTMNDRIGDDELPKNVHWRPIELTFDNLFSYGTGNKINFDAMSGLYGVFSPNATGKTSAFDAMCFALYDKTPRAFKGSHIMNTRENSFSCKLTIEIDQVQYIIERTGSRKKNGEVKVDVNFYKLDGTELISLNGEDRRDTNAAIRSYVGTYEDFILTTLSVQNQNSLFIDTGQSDRKDLLSQFIGLTIFDRLFTFASDEIKEVVGALKNFKQDDFTQTLVDIENDITQYETQFSTNFMKLQEAQKNSAVEENKIKMLYEQKHPLSSDATLNIDELTSEKNKSLEKITNISTEIKDVSEQYSEIKAEIEKYDKQLNECDIHEIEVAYNNWKLAREKKLQLDRNIELLRNDAKNKRSHLMKLKQHKYDPNCSYCMDNIFVKESIEVQREYDALIDKIDILDKSIYDGNKYIESYRDAEQQYNEYMTVRSKKNELSVELSNLGMTLANLTAIETQLNFDLVRYTATIRNIENQKQHIEDNKKIQLQIDISEKLKAMYDTDIGNLQYENQQTSIKIEILKQKKNDILSKLKLAEELETTYEAYETYLMIIGRDGLPYQLISKIIPTLQTEVNSILSQMVDFSIIMEVDGKNINGKIVYEDSRMWPLELASGMEKFVSGLAIRVALMSVSNLPKSNFLVIDEGLGVLDSENLSSMFMLFDILKTQFEFIILISHLDVVRDIADNLIEIKRDNDYSYINLD